MDRPDETKNDQVETAAAGVDAYRQRSKRWYLGIFGFVAAVVIVVVLAIVIDTVPSPGSGPDYRVGFSAGVSLVTSYAVDTKVRSRLATTTLTMEVANALNCQSVHVVSLQLPLNTRVTSLQTAADDGCTSNGEIRKIEDAKYTFEDQVERGVAGAYVEAEDAFTYSVQVSIPPLGVTTVNLVVEQILQQQLGEVAFEIPLIPIEEVDKVVLDLSVEDLSGNPVEFLLDLDLDMIDSNTTKGDGSGNLHLDIPDARQYDLPRVVRGRYNPGVLPERGLLYVDDRCFEHFFVPESLESMARNIFFLLDTTHSLDHANKWRETKEALKNLIDTLTPRDTFTIQTFGDSGTVELWGSGRGTPDEKEEAKQFVTYLQTTSYHSNLNEALLEGLLRAKSAADKSPDDTATVMFLISGSYGRRGESSRSKIAKHVFELNAEGKVKIFTMGFQGDADMELLDGISLLNGGVSAPIVVAGGTGYREQIEEFFSSWLGNILMSDVTVDLAAGNARVFGETQQVFSLLSEGYEVVVRGLLELPETETTTLKLEVPELETTNLKLRAVTSAATLSGFSEWEAVASIPAFGDAPKTASLCFQSYAHARVTQLIRLYEASKFVNHDILWEFATLTDPEGCDAEEKVECIKAEALALALEANLVAKGLTAMVTIEDETCRAIDENAEVCLDGTSPDGGQWTPRGESDSGSGARSRGAVSILLAFLVLVATAFCW